MSTITLSIYNKQEDKVDLEKIACQHEFIVLFISTFIDSPIINISNLNVI